MDRIALRLHRRYGRPTRAANIRLRLKRIIFYYVAVGSGGPSAVAEYQLYFHDSRGHIMRRVDVDVPDDDAARRKACDLDHAECIEVWNLKRRVGIVEPANRRDDRQA